MKERSDKGLNVFMQRCMMSYINSHAAAVPVGTRVRINRGSADARTHRLVNAKMKNVRHGALPDAKSVLP